MNPILSVSALVFVGLVSRWHLSRRPSEAALAEESSKLPALDDKARKKQRLDQRETEKAGDIEKSGENMEKAVVPITDPKWQWSIYDETTKGGRVTVTKREAATDEGAEDGPFRAVYRIRKQQQWPDAVKIHLFSKPLCKIIEQYLPENGDLKTLAEPEIDGRELCIVFDALKNHKFSSERDGELKLANGNGVLEHHELANGDSLQTHELSNGDAECTAMPKEMEAGELHLTHLVRFMDKEYRDVQVRVQRMLEEKKVAWDLLWAFLPPGKKVVYSCDHSEELLYAIVSSNYFVPPTTSDWSFVVELEIWEFDGRSYRKCRIRRGISKYEGERPFAGLAVCPVELFGIPEVLEERFLDNGKRYRDLTIKQKHRFMHYTGTLFQRRLEGGCWRLHKENADGRVMVDLASFAKMNPHYPMGNAQPPTSSRCWTKRGDTIYSLCAVPGSESYDTSFDASEVSEENLIFAPGIVYGFSFSLKMWGSFAINGFRDISFDSLAFHELVMEPQMKVLVRNLVSHYIATPVGGSKPLRRVDPISNKGNGCVFLCYGPPGTGKTLTAESIAETMGRPLWALSVSELGTTPKELEQTLFKVLDIAAAWRAVLLLDEADVYLEKRISGADLTRNAMTGVFLRMLEYYRGVLFLTTNRIGTFDEAFRSRISMFLHYSALSPEHKAKIWKALLDKARVGNVGPEKLSELAALDLNGREIRNTIHTAQSLAQSKEETLELGHVQYVVNVVATSLESLNAALQTRAYN